MLTVYEKILYHAATKNIVPKSVMMILCNSFSPIYRAVNRGIELGYLEERTITVESDGRKYKEDFLVLQHSESCSAVLQKVQFKNSLDKRNRRLILKVFTGKIFGELIKCHKQYDHYDIYCEKYFFLFRHFCIHSLKPLIIIFDINYLIKSLGHLVTCNGVIDKSFSDFL